MGDTRKTCKEVVKPKKDCVCPVCDLLRFCDYANRATSELGPGTKDGSKRMNLIYDIHSTVGMRHPLGIAERLYEAISFLHCGEPAADEDARALLVQMVNDEKLSLVQGREFEIVAGECPVAKRLEKNRALIPELT